MKIPLDQLFTAPIPATQEEALVVVRLILQASLKVRSTFVETNGDDDVAQWLHLTLFPYTAPRQNGLSMITHAAMMADNRGYITGGEYHNLLYMVMRDDLIKITLSMWDVKLPPLDAAALVRNLGCDTPQQQTGGTRA